MWRIYELNSAKWWEWWWKIRCKRTSQNNCWDRYSLRSTPRSCDARLVRNTVYDHLWWGWEDQTCENDVCLCTDRTDPAHGIVWTRWCLSEFYIYSRLAFYVSSDCRSSHRYQLDPPRPCGGWLYREYDRKCQEYGLTEKIDTGGSRC